MKYRKKGTELRKIRGRYYEYRVVYDKERKRAKKITGKLLGSITEENGFIESSKRKLERMIGSGIKEKDIVVRGCKEYGVVRLIEEKFREYNSKLETVALRIIFV